MCDTVIDLIGQGGESIRRKIPDDQLAANIRANQKRQQARYQKEYRTYSVRLHKVDDAPLIDWLEGQYNANFGIKKAIKIAIDHHEN